MNMSSNLPSEYGTKDLYFAASVLSLKIPLLRIDRLDHKVFLFVFPISQEKAAKLMEEYWDRSLTVPVRDFVDAINELKTRMYNRT